MERITAQIVLGMVIVLIAVVGLPDSYHVFNSFVSFIGGLIMGVGYYKLIKFENGKAKEKTVQRRVI